MGTSNVKQESLLCQQALLLKRELKMGDGAFDCGGDLGRLGSDKLD